MHTEYVSPPLTSPDRDVVSPVIAIWRHAGSRGYYATYWFDHRLIVENFPELARLDDPCLNVEVVLTPTRRKNSLTVLLDRRGEVAAGDPIAAYAREPLILFILRAARRWGKPKRVYLSLRYWMPV